MIRQDRSTPVGMIRQDRSTPVGMIHQDRSTEGTVSPDVRAIFDKLNFLASKFIRIKDILPVVGLQHRGLYRNDWIRIKIGPSGTRVLCDFGKTLPYGREQYEESYVIYPGDDETMLKVIARMLAYPAVPHWRLPFEEPRAYLDLANLGSDDACIRVRLENGEGSESVIRAARTLLLCWNNNVRHEVLRLKTLGIAWNEDRKREYVKLSRLRCFLNREIRGVGQPVSS